ncbi:type VI secretion system tube protein Hcp [Bosea sp. 685]|uniref:Hcp family type VI secretion system effector n=1 Tax=Bosea sp. 685 TaxID=3080057 RepID=UPI0028929F67|nr:type VI secretion system tube protein Hcp [Bosea sp. 685]WNJ88324.1 type VI secretion system tube protein Hcp [Bosea sp. 685]
MATAIFLKLDDVESECVIKDQDGKLALDSYSYGVTQAGTSHVATGSTQAISSFSDMSCTMIPDKSAVTLFQFCATGKHIGKGKLTQLKSAGDGTVDFVVIEMEDIVISSFQYSGTDEHVMINFSLNYGTLKVAIAQQAKKGSKGAAPEFKYNIAKGSPA